MSNYTEADVEQARVRVRHLIASQVVSMNEQESLEVLLSAALEGAKVSRLVADNAALVQALHSAKQPHAKGCLFTRGVGTTGQQVRPCPCGVDALFETSSPGAALLAEHEAKVSALQARVDSVAKALGCAASATSEAAQQIREGCRATQDENTALQARVADLESLRRSDEELLEGVRKGWRKAEAERDALRAEAQGALDSLSQPKTFPGDVDLARRILKTALSAPPAETKKAPIGDAAWCAMAAAREADSEVVTGPPAEAPPAPERAEAKRSCNLHADCEAADAWARASGHPNGGEHCNDSDCSDHQ